MNRENAKRLGFVVLLALIVLVSGKYPVTIQVGAAPGIQPAFNNATFAPGISNAQIIGVKIESQLNEHNGLYDATISWESMGASKVHLEVIGFNKSNNTWSRHYCDDRDAKSPRSVGGLPNERFLVWIQGSDASGKNGPMLTEEFTSGVAWSPKNGGVASLVHETAVPIEQWLSGESHGFSSEQVKKVRELLNATPQPTHPVSVDGLTERNEPAITAPAPQPTFVQPLEVSINSPRDALVGDMVTITAEVSGTPTDFEWSVDPPLEGLMVLDGGRKAVFANREAGDYLIMVAVAGNGGQVRSARKVFSLLPAPPENPITAQSLPLAAPPVDVGDLVRRWVAEVRTVNKPGESQAIAGSFRAMAALARQGNIGSDPLRDVEAAGEEAVTPQRFAAWEPFFGHLREFLFPLNQSGHLQTADQYANVFEKIAGMLEASAAGQ